MNRRQFAARLFEVLIHPELVGSLEAIGDVVDRGTLDHNDAITGPTAGSRIDLELTDGSTVEIMVRKFP